MTPHRRTPFLFDAVFCVLRRFKPEVVLGYPSGFFASSGRLRGRQRGCEGSRVASLDGLSSFACAHSGLALGRCRSLGIGDAVGDGCGSDCLAHEVGTRSVFLRVPEKSPFCGVFRLVAKSWHTKDFASCATASVRVPKPPSCARVPSRPLPLPSPFPKKIFSPIFPLVYEWKATQNRPLSRGYAKNGLAKT